MLSNKIRKLWSKELKNTPHKKAWANNRSTILFHAAKQPRHIVRDETQIKHLKRTTTSTGVSTFSQRKSYMYTMDIRLTDFASIDQLKQISHDYTIHSLLSLSSCFFTSSGLGRKTSDINMSWESPNLRTQSRASEAEGREIGSLEHIMSNKSMSGWERWWRY